MCGSCWTGMHEDFEMGGKEDGCVHACVREWLEAAREGGGKSGVSCCATALRCTKHCASGTLQQLR